jgi:cytochrome c55X
MRSSAAFLAALACFAPHVAFSQQAQDKLVPLVRQDCGSCHGLTLKGGLGPALLPQNLAGKDEDALADIILGGVPGTPMPPWRGLISENDAHWIAGKLKEGFPQ